METNHTARYFFPFCDESLSSDTANNSAKVIDLAQKRGEVEKALMATEETWLALSSQAEEAAAG